LGNMGRNRVQATLGNRKQNGRGLRERFKQCLQAGNGRLANLDMAKRPRGQKWKENFKPRTRRGTSGVLIRGKSKQILVLWATNTKEGRRFLSIRAVAAIRDQRQLQDNIYRRHREKFVRKVRKRERGTGEGKSRAYNRFGPQRMREEEENFSSEPLEESTGEDIHL